MTNNTPQHLRNAPIIEAILEILVDLPDKSDFPKIEALYETIKKDFPQKKIRSSFDQTITTELSVEGKIDSKFNEHGPDAVIGQSEDGKNAIQFRMDGMSYSQLKPYTSWVEVSRKAFELWSIYKTNLSPIKVKRLGLRYINLIEMPVPIKLSEILKNPINLPVDGGQVIRSFVNRVEFKDPITNFDAIFTLATQPPVDDGKERIGRIFLDIDVMCDVSDLSDEKIVLSNTFEKMRDFKNELFFGSLTEQQIARYK